jgi:hypothetical protein
MFDYGQPFCVERQDRDARTVVTQSAGDREANPARAAGDKSNPSLTSSLPPPPRMGSHTARQNAHPQAHLRDLPATRPAGVGRTGTTGAR